MKKNLLDFQLFSHVSHVDLMLFTKHLSVMLNSGITIFEAIQILILQTKSDAFKSTLKSIKSDLENGKLLSQALSKYPKAFNKFYVSLVEVGEESGKLQDNLKYLADYLGKDYAFRKKVKGAMIYPTLVLVFAFGVGMFLSIFVLPNLVELFQGLDVKLPWTTQLLLGFSLLVRDHGIVLLAAVILTIFLFKLIINLPSIAPLWSKLLLSTPVFGRLIQNVVLTSICRNLGIMLASGLSLTKALEVEYKAEGNLVFKEYIKKLHGSLSHGKSLSEELESGRYRLFPLIAVKMIGVGEKTGKLDETLTYLADFFEEEVDDATKNIATILEPVLLLIIGLVVTFVAFAIMSPIYEFTGSIKR